MANHHVFISYKSEDYTEALWMKQILELNNIQCWIAPDNICGGSNYARDIPKAIEECKVFVVLLTSKTQQSTWVPKELDLAINSKKTIMPFMIEECQLHNEFNFYLGDVQRYDAYKNMSSAIQKLVTEIWLLLGINRAEQDIVLQPKPEATTQTAGLPPVMTETKLSKTPFFPNKGVFFRWLLPAYCLSIPAGLIITLIALIRKFRHFDQARTNQLVKIWSIIAMPIGFLFYVMAVTDLDNSIHILYTSILGLVTLIIQYG